MSKELQIKDRTYYFGTLPASKAITVEVAVAKVVGEPLFKAFVASKNGGATQDAEAAGAAAMGLLASRMDSAELLQTMSTVFEHVTYGTGTEQPRRIGSIDEAFTGRNRELWQVFIGALRFNFADFFPESLLDSLPASLKAA